MAGAGLWRGSSGPGLLSEARRESRRGPAFRKPSVPPGYRVSVPIWFRTWLLPVLTLLFTAGAAVSGAFIQDSDGGIRLWPSVGAVACIVAAGVLALFEKRAAARLEDDLIAEQVDARVAINDMLEPLVGELGRAMAAQGSTRTRLLEGVVPAGLAAATNLLGGHRTRASFFRLHMRDDEPDSDTFSVEFRPEQSHGRAGRPRTVFTSDDEQGKRLIDLLLNEPGYDFCADVEKDAPPAFTGAGHGYRSYLAVLAEHGPDISGIVTVDSPEANDFTPEDRHFLRVVATIISIAVEEAARATPGG